MPTVWYSQTNVQHKVLTCKKTVRRKATRTLREMAWLAFSMLTRQPFKSNLWSQSYFGLCPLQIAVCFQFMSGQTTWVLDKYVFSVGLPIPIPINFNCVKDNFWLCFHLIEPWAFHIISCLSFYIIKNTTINTIVTAQGATKCVSELCESRIENLNLARVSVLRLRGSPGRGRLLENSWWHFFITRLKPSCSRQGLGWDHWAGTFWVFLTSHFVPLAFDRQGDPTGLLDDPKT